MTCKYVRKLRMYDLDLGIFIIDNYLHVNLMICVAFLAVNSGLINQGYISHSNNSRKTVYNTSLNLRFTCRMDI